MKNERQRNVAVGIVKTAEPENPNPQRLDVSDKAGEVLVEKERNNT